LVIRVVANLTLLIEGVVYARLCFIYQFRTGDKIIAACLLEHALVAAPDMLSCPRQRIR